MKEKIIIFGCGRAGLQALVSLGNYIDYVDVVGFSDNDKTKIGSSFCNKPIIDPNQLKYMTHIDRIIIASMYYEAISQQLLEDGIRKIEVFESYICRLDMRANLLLQESNNDRTYISQVLGAQTFAEINYKPITKTCYVRQEEDPKVIAYYLPQFYPTKHNDEWWGKGTTEWNNVARAVPQYVGHYQPKLPGELGFYDLRLKENLARQIELAKMYGIYGFSYYYYNFSGERYLEKPLDMLLENKELDMPFSLCWANENWTAGYEPGREKHILLEQKKDVQEYKNVIKDMHKYLIDQRYITVDGKKMITVYRPENMPRPNEVLEFWREYCREEKIGEIYIIGVRNSALDEGVMELGFDAQTEFQPASITHFSKEIKPTRTSIVEHFRGKVFDYEDIVKSQQYKKAEGKKFYRAVMPNWDNTARKNNQGVIFENSTPALYKQWLKAVLSESKRKDLDESMVFINAWNEWGEGQYLEPDKRYGYAYLNATKEALEEIREKE